MPRTDFHSPSEDPVDPDERPSKTQRKKESHELQDLGEALVALPESRVKDLAIPENLRDAVHEYRRTRTHEGKRRQMQYIGKLMRGTDTGPIRQAVLDMQLGRARTRCRCTSRNAGAPSWSPATMPSPASCRSSRVPMRSSCAA